MQPLKIFLGWDPRETEAYHVFAHSIITRASRPVSIIPLVQSQLRAQGIYHRAESEQAATQFSFTRFLVPFLSGFRGVSIFADCDMLCLTDIHELVEETLDGDSPVWACKHDYTPKSQMKMDGQIQTKYPKKNWSSLMVFRNARCRMLNPGYVSRAAGSELHQFYWLGNAPTNLVGSLPIEWNWLADEYEQKDGVKIVHYTLGGPWFDQTKNCDYADLWEDERDGMLGLTPARVA